MRAALALWASSVVLLIATTASAQSPLEEARTSYELGAAAYDRKDYAVAAARFRDADERVANPRAFKLALASALLASDPVLAMGLADRAESRGPDASTGELVRRLRARFAGEAARVAFSCPPRFECRAYVDGREVDMSRPVWTAAGKHSFVVSAKGAAVFERETRASGGDHLEIAPSERDLTLPPAAPPPAPAPLAVLPQVAPSTPDGPRPDSGVSPIWFGGAVAATLLSAGAGAYLTVVAKDRHDAFVADPSAESAADGDAVQTQARIAFAAAGGFALTAVVLAVFTDFGGERPPPLTVGIHDRGAALGGRF